MVGYKESIQLLDHKLEVMVPNLKYLDVSLHPPVAALVVLSQHHQDFVNQILVWALKPPVNRAKKNDYKSKRRTN